MNDPAIQVRKRAGRLAKRALVFGACLGAILAAPALAQTAEAPPAPLLAMQMIAPRPVGPSHFATRNQFFEQTVAGLRAYIESIKVAEPQLYAQLAPDVERLESQQATALTVLVAGLVIGVGSTIYGFASRSNCQQPSLADPDFAAKSAAWGSCVSDNIDRTATFTFIGLGAAVAGGFACHAIAPDRSDLLEVLNKNNRLSPEPLRLQLGYDPNHQLAFAGAAVTF
jgi:hypothetical protein